MNVRAFKQPDGKIAVLIPTLEALAKGKTLDELAQKAGLTGDFEDIEQSLLPDRKYRNEWRAKSGGGVEVPTELKESRDALIRLDELDTQTKFNRAIRELRIAQGIAAQAEIDAEAEAQTLRPKIRKG